MTGRRAPRLVRYVSPFGSPAWMVRERAERYLAEDDRLWELFAEAERLGAGDLLGEHARRVGPPRIEHLHG